VGQRLRRQLTGHTLDVRPGDYRKVQGPTAILACPLCGTHQTLVNHKITGAGDVSPSVRCVNPACPWHEYCVLDGWGY
jgi:hypothetical protein